MKTFPTHEDDVRELYEKLTVEIPGATSIRAINLQAFTAAIDQMMNKAFYYGTEHSMKSVHEIMDRVFSKNGQSIH